MTGHICVPHAETVSPLIDGRRSSVREKCRTCGTTSTWIVRADGSIVALAAKKQIGVVR